MATKKPTAKKQPKTAAAVSVKEVLLGPKKRPRGRPFAKGNTLRKEGKSGRKKGTPNKVSATMAEAIMDAFRELGDVKGLVDWVKANKGKHKPTFYANMATRLIPVQLTGEGGGPIDINQRTTLSHNIMAAAGAVRGNGHDKTPDALTSRNTATEVPRKPNGQ